MQIHLPSSLLHAAQATLRAGGVIAYATESCYGLGCRPGNARGLKAILRLKGRPNRKGMIVVGQDFEQLATLLKPVTVADRTGMQAHWPGPVTLLLPAARRTLPLLRGRHDKLAVRVTAHAQTAALCRRLGPLVSTSANFAGQCSLKSAAACRRAFGEAVLVLPGQVGRRRKPSTIIDFASGRVLR